MFPKMNVKASALRRGTRVAKNIVGCEFSSQGGTQIQVPAAVETAAAAVPAESAVVLESTTVGRISFQASRYCSNLDLLDPGRTHKVFRF
jgi:hypothetical protein